MIYFIPKLSIQAGGQHKNYTSPKCHLNPSLKVQEGLKAGLLSAKKEIAEVNFAVWRSHWMWICISVGTCFWLDLLALITEKVVHWDTSMEMEAFLVAVWR